MQLNRILFLIALSVTTCLATCTVEQGDFRYKCYWGSSCEVDLPGNFELISIDGNYPRISITLDNDGSIGAIQDHNADTKLVKIGYDEKTMLAILENGDAYVAPLSIGPFGKMTGPMSISKAKTYFDGELPILLYVDKKP